MHTEGNIAHGERATAMHLQGSSQKGLLTQPGGVPRSPLPDAGL